MPARSMRSSRRRCGSSSRVASRSSSRPQDRWVRQVHAPRRAPRLPAARHPDGRARRARPRRSTGCRRRPELGWSRPRGGPAPGRTASATSRPARPSAPTTPSSSSPSCPTTSRPTPGAPRPASRSGRRAIGYGLAATIHADSLDEVFDALAPPSRSGPTTTSCRASGIVLILRRVGDGARRVVAAHYVRPTVARRARPRPATRARGPRHLGAEPRPIRAFRLGRHAGARAPRRAQGRRLRARGRSSP